MKQKIIYVVSVIIALFVGVIGTIICVKYIPTTTVVQGDGTKKNVTVTETNTLKDAIDKVYDAVYVIESYKNGQQISTGTGFVYKKDDEKGYVITNHHVIEEADQIKVTTMDGNTVDATLLGSDEYSDIAVLSVDVDVVTLVATIGDSSELSLGDTLFTVGSPLGSDYAGTVTKGILSGNNRTVTTSNNVMDVLQTDAAINPGNSGGPLCNVNGEVIGVNSLKLVEDEIEGMGFAIPIDIVMSSVEYLEKGEEIVRPMVGLEMIDADNVYALYRYGIRLSNDDPTEGVVVMAVTNGGPAESAGIEKGDIITEIDGEAISNSSELRHMLYKHQVGDTIKITAYRNGSKKEFKVTLTAQQQTEN